MRITGERVVLRDWVAADLPVFRRWLEPGQEWQRWDAPYYPGLSAEEADRSVRRLAAAVEEGDWPEPRGRLVIADPVDDRFLGIVTWYWESEPSEWRRVGLVLYDPASWSGGRGTEALRLWTAYLFATTDAHRLDFATWSGNERMCRAGLRVGFVEEARFREAREVDGRRYDSVIYGVLRRDWPAPTP